jgi:hypothetical protein
LEEDDFFILEDCLLGEDRSVPASVIFVKLRAFGASFAAPPPISTRKFKFSGCNGREGYLCIFYT